MTLLICQICNKKFESENTRQKICDDPECTRIRSRQYYLKWKEAHPTEYQKHRQAQAKRRRKERTALKYDDVIIPKAVKKRRCQRCGKLTVNRFNCPVCLNILTEGISGQYDNFIFISDDIDIGVPV